MRTKTFILLACICVQTLFSTKSLAESDNAPLLDRSNIDMVITPSVWHKKDDRLNFNNNNLCPPCCVYKNHNYSEGAILKVDGGVLQCVRDQNVVGTNPLIWKLVPK